MGEISPPPADLSAAVYAAWSRLLGVPSGAGSQSAKFQPRTETVGCAPVCPRATLRLARCLSQAEPMMPVRIVLSQLCPEKQSSHLSPGTGSACRRRGLPDESGSAAFSNSNADWPSTPATSVTNL